MSERHNLRKLKAHILNLSEADNFDDAKSEWKLDYIYITEEYGRCPCNVRIKEHCSLKNEKNKNTTWVGNVCVRRFMNIDSGSLFRSLKTIRGNRSAKPNMSLINYAWDRRYLYGKNEYNFLADISRKRRLSQKQLNWLLKINRRILEKIVVRRVPDQINTNDDEEAHDEMNGNAGAENMRNDNDGDN